MHQGNDKLAVNRKKYNLQADLSLSTSSIQAQQITGYTHKTSLLLKENTHMQQTQLSSLASHIYPTTGTDNYRVCTQNNKLAIHRKHK